MPTKEDRDAAQARAQRDAASKAVLDNMARLKALRLAREAAEPQTVAAPKKASARGASKPAKKSKEPAPALSEWLASQQNGGRRT